MSDQSGRVSSEVTLTGLPRCTSERRFTTTLDPDRWQDVRCAREVGHPAHHAYSIWRWNDKQEGVDHV